MDDHGRANFIQMNQTEYKALAQKANEALDAFRKIQAIHDAAESFATATKVNPTKIKRLEFHVEFMDQGGFRRMVTCVNNTDMFFGRVVKDFLAMTSGAKVEAEKLFESL